MLENLRELGFLQMTPIQAAALPAALAGKDVIAQARTGSGKTVAFGLPLLNGLNPRRFAVQGMVLCPTRELADQVSTEIRRLARATDNIKVVTLCGGVALRGQTASLENGAHLVVGTPGRIHDHLERGNLDLQALSMLVLDEADRMLDMGFHDDIVRVVGHCPATRQTLLFSATYPEGIDALAARFMRTPQRITVSETRQKAAQAQIEQRFFEVTRANRFDTVSRVLRHFRPTSTIAFCNTKAQCNELVAYLQAQDIPALALHGDLEQRDRDQVLAQFAGRCCPVLVATDVAARGLDIAQLEAVINVTVSPDAENHVHRIGRTGRAGESGLAISLATMDEMGAVGRIEQYQEQQSTWFPLDTLTPAAGGPLRAPMAMLHLAGGRKEKIRAGDVLGALTAPDAGFTREQIGKISVTDYATFIAVQRELAPAAVQALNRGKVKGRSVRCRLL